MPSLMQGAIPEREVIRLSYAVTDPKVMWHHHTGDGPTIGLAVHAGHEIRTELLPYLDIDEAARIREEDPYTDYWTLACDNQIITRRSRFEVDLNRPPDEAICIQPEDCWDLRVWNEQLPYALYERSLVEHAAFYEMFGKVLSELQQAHGKFVVFDIHSYNHRREGPNAAPADPMGNPEINIGTGSMDREYWAPVVDRIIADLRGFDFAGRQLDVRENVSFKGRFVAQFVHEKFPQCGCAIAIEVKKFFMDEWTGVGHPEEINAMREAIAAAAAGAREELSRL